MLKIFFKFLLKLIITKINYIILLGILHFIIKLFDRTNKFLSIFIEYNDIIGIIRF